MRIKKNMKIRKKAHEVTYNNTQRMRICIRKNAYNNTQIMRICIRKDAHKYTLKCVLRNDKRRTFIRKKAFYHTVIAYHFNAFFAYKDTLILVYICAFAAYHLNALVAYKDTLVLVYICAFAMRNRWEDGWEFVNNGAMYIKNKWLHLTLIPLAVHIIVVLHRKIQIRELAAKNHDNVVSSAKAAVLQVVEHGRGKNGSQALGLLCSRWVVRNLPAESFPELGSGGGY
jgi:hypothetical protein